MKPPSEKNKILLVDDEPVIVEVVKKRLEVSGFDVVVATDGAEALQKAHTEEPKLIILDVMLPKIDGYMVCGVLKKDNRTSKIPIVMLTARSQAEDEKISLECGADAYVKKPFDSQELLEKIRALIVSRPPSAKRT
jgi:DNA-binding response OmpR family regulator